MFKNPHKMNIRIPLLVCFLLFSIASIKAQETYFVNRKSIDLKTEVKGTIELLWNVFDQKNRYFLKKGNYIIELKNSKRKGREDYKQVLEAKTSDVGISAQDVELTLPSLREFFITYNNLTELEPGSEKQVELRIGVFGGATNSVYTENITNESQAFVGLELELVDLVMLKRHSMVLDFRNTFEGNEHKYSMAQFALNYRLKFINSKRFAMYVNTKFASYTMFKSERPSLNDSSVILQTSGNIFNAPISFGLGADIKVGKNYITLGYHDFYSLTMTGNDQFPNDYSLGYRFSL